VGGDYDLADTVGIGLHRNCNSRHCVPANFVFVAGERSMSHPSRQQAIGYAQWYLLRGLSEEEIDRRLQLSQDHDWLTEEERKMVITEAQNNIKALKAIWEKMPHIKPELTQGGFLKRPQYRRTK
jgi:hypothetical protein